MALEKLMYWIGIDGSDATKELKSIGNTADTELGKSGKAFDNFKAKGASAMEGLKAHAATFAIAAGTAIAAFGVKAVKEFTDSALAADKFANSTGMSVDNASRWLGVMGQWGVEMGDLQDVFNNVAGKIEESDPIFEKLGITVAKAADGTTDLDGTMKNIVQSLAAVEDPATRAAAAAAFFGEEGARQFGELVAKGKDVEEIFASLSESKVIDEGEVKKAREFQAAMKQLNDRVTELTMTVGEGLVPAVSDAAEQLMMLVDTAEKLKLIDLAQAIQKWDFVTPAGQARILADAIRGDVVFSIKDFTGSSEELRAEMEALGHSEENIVFMLEAYAKKQAEATTATEENTEATEDNTAAVEKWDGVLRGAAGSAAGFSKSVDGIKAAQDYAAESADRHREAEENLLNFINGQLGNVFAYETATHNLANANTDLAAKIGEVRTAHENGELSGAEYETALRNLRLEEIATAEQARDVAAAFAESKGASADSTAGLALQKEELKRLQAQFPQLREEIQAYIDILNKIPATKSTVIHLSRTGSRLGASSGDLQAFDEGGVVQGPRGSEQLIVAHGGETVLPTHKPGSTSPSTSGGAAVTAVFSDEQVQILAAAFRQGIGANDAAGGARVRAGRRP